MAKKRTPDTFAALCVAIVTPPFPVLKSLQGSPLINPRAAFKIMAEEEGGDAAVARHNTRMGSREKKAQRNAKKKTLAGVGKERKETRCQKLFFFPSISAGPPTGATAPWPLTTAREREMASKRGVYSSPL